MKKPQSPASLPTNGEKITRGHTPKGVGPVFSRIASFRRETTARLLRLFSLWGYTEITLPVFEYLDSLAPGLDPVLQHKAYTLQDRGSGHVLLLRPDATAQIARLVAQGQENTTEVQNTLTAQQFFVTKTIIFLKENCFRQALSFSESRTPKPTGKFWRCAEKVSAFFISTRHSCPCLIRGCKRLSWNMPDKICPFHCSQGFKEASTPMIPSP